MGTKQDSAEILKRFRNDLKRVPTPDLDARTAAATRQGSLTKPPGSLGRLEDIALHMAGWQGRAIPKIDNGTIIIFAGSHGIARESVSAFPPEVTAQMVANFKAGGAAINQLARSAGLGLQVIALEVDTPTEPFHEKPAMKKPDFANALQVGRDAVGGDLDLLILGEMGIGNTTSAAALFAAVFDGDGKQWAGAGTGVSGGALTHKAAIIDAGLWRHNGKMDDPLEILRRLGGREFAAIAGALLEARIKRVPVILDGFGVTAAASVLWRIDPDLLANCLAGHVSAEKAHRAALKEMGFSPLLDLGLRLGEASGAAMAAHLVRAALAIHSGMATFAEAGVASGNR